MTRPADTPHMAVIRKHSTQTLEATDCCDRCGGRAYVQATMINGSTVLFCAHHGREHMPRLVDQALVIDDYTPYLEGQETRAPIV